MTDSCEAIKEYTKELNGFFNDIIYGIETIAVQAEAGRYLLKTIRPENEEPYSVSPIVGWSGTGSAITTENIKSPGPCMWSIFDCAIDDVEKLDIDENIKDLIKKYINHYEIIIGK